ncbi:flagellar hook-length control protein FliK, partial [Roseomonas sp. PWR1]
APLDPAARPAGTEAALPPLPPALAAATAEQAPRAEALPPPGLAPNGPVAPAPDATLAGAAGIEAAGGVQRESAPVVEATPAPRAAPPAPPARQITPLVVALSLGGDASLSITLDPGELGRVEVSVERVGEMSEVRILAERPETLALLQRDHRELDRALTQAGLQPEGRALSFGLSADGQGSGHAQGRRDEQGGRAPQGQALAADAGPRGATPAAPPPRRALSLIDLAI